MFDWLKPRGPETPGILNIMRYFGQMLEDGRHIFDAAANSLLGGTDPETIQEDLWATDKRINANERRIRRKVVIHAAVYGAREFPICLVLMSLVKDAERLGDYAKNLFDLARVRRDLPEDSRKELIELKDTISRMLVRARNIYEAQDTEGAKAFLAEGDSLAAHCDARVDALLLRNEGGGEITAAALAYRYYKRVVAHLVNIITSIVVPIDQLDYYDEDFETRETPAP